MRAAVISFGAAALLILTLALPVATGVPANTASPVTFTDVSRNSGITFQHDNAMSAEKFLIETMGAGAAWLDYDNDGYLDLYLVNGAATKAYVPSHPLGSALYHSNGDGTFTDVTAKAGVAATGLFGMGVAVGDYDNDGFPDLYVTGYGRSVLYHNNGDGTFSDVTAKAGVSAPGWAASAVWFDYDSDGRLDLFVCRYVDFDKTKHHRCTTLKVPGLPDQAAYCNPRSYGPTAN